MDNNVLSEQMRRLAARRAEAYPHLFAGVLASYATLNGLDEEGLLTRLGCDAVTLDRLRLCRRPDPAGFADDIREVAEKLGLDAGTLAALVREVEATGALAAGGADVREPLPFSSTQGGMLKAARDREVAREEGEGNGGNGGNEGGGKDAGRSE